MYYWHFKDNIKLSALGMGNMRLPEKEDGEIDYAQAKGMIDFAVAQGVNYFDTAYIYHNGKSEKFVGEALADYRRDQYYLATKYNKVNPDFRAEFAEQLVRLRTNYIDFYLLHGLQDNTADFYLNCGALEYFDEQKREGAIKYLGVSVHCSPEKFEEILAVYPWDFVQLQLNYYDWFYGDAKALYEAAEKRSIPIMVMEPVRGGKLASLPEEGSRMLLAAEPNKSAASWAFRWVQGRSQVAVVLSGMSNMEQLTDNIRSFDTHAPLTSEQEDLLTEVCRLFRSTMSVACTSCRYCCDGCPQHIDIPFLLSVYNDIKLGGEWRAAFLDGLPAEKDPASCIGCGACTGLCPQGIQVPQYLEELAGIRR
jgi:predicted aldo/keto reductase-like oxidoreductase